MKTILRAITLTALVGFVLFTFMARTSSAFPINNPTGTGSSLCTNESTQSSTYCNDTQNNGGTNGVYGTGGAILIAINIISIVGGVAAVIIIIISGIRLAVSGGDTNQVNSARNSIIYAFVGLVVISAAELIVRYALGLIT